MFARLSLTHDADRPKQTFSAHKTPSHSHGSPNLRSSKIEPPPPPPPIAPIGSSHRKAAEVGGMSGLRPGPSLVKHRSWSPDSEREEIWLRRKGLHRGRGSKIDAGRSVTEEDLDELRGCIDLGFGFDDIATVSGGGGDADSRRLTETFPALDLYYAVNRSYNGRVSRSSPSVSSSDGSPVGSPLSIITPGDKPEMVKARLKQWAQVVACSVRQRRTGSN